MAGETRRGKVGSLLNDLIAPLAPGLALKREVALAQRAMLRSQMGHYNGAGRSARGSDFRRNRTDAVEAARYDRQPISLIARDMLRNNPRARRIVRQLRNQVVGAGIQPAVHWGRAGEVIAPEGRRDLDLLKGLIRRHCLATDFDTEGMLTLFGMQGLAFSTLVSDGEVLLRRRRRGASDGLTLPFQVQILEADYLDHLVDGDLPNGNYAVQGIEFDRIGRRVAYHLYPEHPGGFRGLARSSRRVSAENIIHAFDVARPGQQRGVSWLAPVITKLHELDKYQEGQIKRQEIAAMFAAVLQTDEVAEAMEGQIGALEPGAILTLGEGESMDFTDPPAVDGYEPFMRVTDRVIAAAMGITYEALTGDYSNVNYTSGRMGRMDVDPNVRDWQTNIMVAQVCAGLGRWIAEAVEDQTGIDRDAWGIKWTPPVRPVVDPTKDHKADETAARTGKKSRRDIIRESGRDPDEVEAEILAERAWEGRHGLVFTSNAGAAPSPGAAQAANAGEQNDD